MALRLLHEFELLARERQIEVSISEIRRERRGGAIENQRSLVLVPVMQIVRQVEARFCVAAWCSSGPRAPRAPCASGSAPLAVHCTSESITNVAEIFSIHFTLRIYSNLGVLMSNINTWSVDQAVPLAPKGRGSIDLEIDFLNLMPGTYYAGVEVASMYDIHDSLENVVKIDLEPSDYYGTGRGVEERFGLVFFQLPEHALCTNTVLNSTRAKSYPNLF
jgi:hypothetical protein